MIHLDAPVELPPVPHLGYRDGEVPRYSDCANCGMRLRADRTDLVAEHNAVCANKLTPRELEVLQFIANGYTNGEIAGELWVTLETVKTHVARILRKWRTPSRASATAIGFRQGLIR